MLGSRRRLLDETISRSVAVITDLVSGSSLRSALEERQLCETDRGRGNRRKSDSDIGAHGFAVGRGLLTPRWS